MIADTSGLYALVDRADPHHSKAVSYLKSRASNRALLVSNHIFDETMTLVKARLGTRVALQLGLRLRNSRFVEMVIFSGAEEQETWRIFSQYADKEWSYTDCACLVLARERGIHQAFTFDHHFAQMGLVMVPQYS
ncbi:MAG: PIN domain-containing protein [Anaerolineae bacterium]